MERLVQPWVVRINVWACDYMGSIECEEDKEEQEDHHQDGAPARAAAQQKGWTRTAAQQKAQKTLGVRPGGPGLRTLHYVLSTACIVLRSANVAIFLIYINALLVCLFLLSALRIKHSCMHIKHSSTAYKTQLYCV